MRQKSGRPCCAKARWSRCVISTRGPERVAAISWGRIVSSRRMARRRAIKGCFWSGRVGSGIDTHSMVGGVEAGEAEESWAREAEGVKADKSARGFGKPTCIWRRGDSCECNGWALEWEYGLGMGISFGCNGWALEWEYGWI